MAIKKLLFIDTNILLDHYRFQNEAALKLLRHAEKIADRIICTYQVEIEFKKNRQTVLLQSLNELHSPPRIPTPGILRDAKAARALGKSSEQLKKRVERVRALLTRALVDPATNDPVYQLCQRIFRKEGPLVLRHEDKSKHAIRRRALRRFMHGCPPRKKDDTSIGDAINWEWMLHCADKFKSELVICSRDGDYCVTFKDKGYINDHLRQEFSERVSQKRKLILHPKLSEALKEFKVPVTRGEEQAESEGIKATSLSDDARDAAGFERRIGYFTTPIWGQISRKTGDITVGRWEKLLDLPDVIKMEKEDEN